MRSLFFILIFSKYLLANGLNNFDINRLTYIDSLANKLIEEKVTTGLSIYINSFDQAIYNKDFGYTNVSKTQLINDNTTFRIYSMTKPITSVALMILLERGLVNLDDPISKFLPEFSKMKKIKIINLPIIKHLFHLEQETKQPITIFHLLTHTSGLYYDFSSKYMSIYKKYLKYSTQDHQTLAEYSQSMSKLPLLFEPGTDFNYGINTDILGRVIEVASGINFEDFIMNEIFIPLEMNNTSFNLNNNLLNLPTVYENVNDKLITDNRLNITPIEKFPMGGAGLFSNISDYSNFCSMLMNNGVFKNKTIISKSSIELMTQNHIKTLNGPNAQNISKRLPITMVENLMDTKFPMDGFGLGFYVNESITQQQSIGNINRYGWMGAANTYFFIDKDNDFFVIIMMQSRINFKLLNRFENAIYQALR